jgi:hypothetical protein
MSDQIPPNSPPGSMGSAVDKNLSMLNQGDVALQMASGQITPDMTIRDFFKGKGIDVDGPLSQLMDFMGKQKENANPINKMRNIAADTALQRGGGPQTQPGVKPMVAPPVQPAPAGMEGLMNRLGG